MIDVEPPLDTVLVFNRDGDLFVFEAFIHATNWTGGTVELRFRFTLSGPLISRLIIAP